jgi:prevent-host-death family protein
MKSSRPKVVVPRRVSATDARRDWVRLLQEVAEDGRPVEITRRQRTSVFLVRASDFEAALGRVHPWSNRRVRNLSGTVRPNGIVPGVWHRWEHVSSTAARDRLGEVLGSVDADREPLLVTRQGRSGLMLLAACALERHWNMPAQGEAAP